MAGAADPGQSAQVGPPAPAVPVTDAEAVRTMLLRLVDGRVAHRLRLEAGLTQDELAQRARVSRRTVGRLEDGEHVRPESAAQIAKALESLSPRGAGPAGRSPVDRE